MQDSTDKKGPAVKFPPPLIFLFAMLISFALQQWLPLSLGSSTLIRIVGFILVLSGVLVLAIAARGFAKVKTQLEPWKPTTQIVTSGIYAWSRNPIYVAFCIITAGIACIALNAWMLMSCLPAAGLVYLIAIRREERYLLEKFGAEYQQYCARVRRWV